MIVVVLRFTSKMQSHFISSLGCTDIKLVTSKYGNTNSWTFGRCRSNDVYGSNQTRILRCCQHIGEYNLTCETSSGEGWHEGYIEIAGTQYCRDFQKGYSQSQLVTMSRESLYDISHFNYVIWF